jgi:hypothetical protein
VLRWLTTPAEPRDRYLVYTAALGVALFSFSGAIWPDRGPAGLAVAVLLSAAGGSAAAKVILGAGRAPDEAAARSGKGADDPPEGPGEKTGAPGEKAGTPGNGEER